MGKGRTEKLTQDGIRTAIKYCRAGLPDCQIAAILGVTRETYSRWINHPKTENQRQLAHALKKADAEREANLVSRIMRASDDTWQAAAWLLERKYPERYARPDEARGQHRHRRPQGRQGARLLRPERDRVAHAAH